MITLPEDHPAIRAIGDALGANSNAQDVAANALEEAESVADNLRSQLVEAEERIQRERTALHNLVTEATQLTNALHLLGN